MAGGDDNSDIGLAALVESVTRMVPVATVITDASGRLLAANDAWRRLSEAGRESLPVEAWTDRLEPASRRRLCDEMARVGRGEGPVTVDLEMHLSAGPRWSRWWVHRRHIDDTAVLVLVCVDVHDDAKQRDDLRQLASRDDLTGLVNRRFFLETVEQALRRAERFPEPACLLYIDLDHFKTVNDRAGHAVGDRVLAAVAARLDQAVRGADVVGRIGGDEFAVLIERMTSPGEAAVVARRIQEALSGAVDVDGRQWPISASVGIAMVRPHTDTAADLLSRADAAMYEAKRARPAPPAAGASVTPLTDREAEAGPRAAPGSAQPDRRSPGARSRVAEQQEMAGEPRRAAGEREAAGETKVRPEPAPDPATTPSYVCTQATATVTLSDLRALREGMDTIRSSLEALLEGLQAERL